MTQTLTEDSAISAVYAARRANLRALADRFNGTSLLAAKLGFAHPSYLSQLIGPNPTRNVSESSARRYEARLGLQAGWLDIARG